MYHIIVNPSSKSGMGRKKWKTLKNILLQEMVTYNVQFTKGHMDAYKCARKLTSKIQSGLLHLIVVGGDGTINEVLNGIMDFDNTVLTYLPTGSSNDLARDMNRFADADDFLFHLKQDKNRIKNMDYGISTFKGGQRKFAVSCGIGFDADVCEQAFVSKLKRFLNIFRLGKLTYGVIALKLLLAYRPVSADIYLDDNPKPLHIDKLLFAAAMNHRYEGGGFLFAPEADATDGILDLCVAGDLSLPRILYLLPLALKGKHVGHKGIHNLKAKKIEIKVSKPLTVHTDGEICGKHDTLVLSCENNRLQYI